METVQEKLLPPLWVAGIRMQARYQDCGKVFARLGRRVGRFASGKPLCLFYSDYQPQAADFEPCMPIRELSDEQCCANRESTSANCRAVRLSAWCPVDRTRHWGRRTTDWKNTCTNGT